MSAPLFTGQLPLRLGTGLNTPTHWRHRHARVKREHDIVEGWWALALRARAGEPSRHARAPLRITLTRFIGPRGRPYDSDNLASAFKAVRDAVAKAIGVDDKDPRVVWAYEQEKGTDWVVGIRVERREPGACPTCGQPKPTVHARLGPREFPGAFVPTADDYQISKFGNPPLHVDNPLARVLAEGATVPVHTSVFTVDWGGQEPPLETPDGCVERRNPASSTGFDACRPRTCERCRRPMTDGRCVRVDCSASARPPLPQRPERGYQADLRALATSASRPAKKGAGRG